MRKENRKVLLIGQLNEIVRSLNECLADDFQVQLCSEQLENVQGMMKIVKPDLIIVCQIGVEEIDSAIFCYLQQKCSKIPVLGITTLEEWKQCRGFYETKQFAKLFRPVNKEELLRKCHQILDSEAGEEYTESAIAEKKKILIVDDSSLLLRNMNQMLKDQYTIFLATSGKQALKFIPEKQPDLIILDYEMPGMDGKATFEAIKEDEDSKDIPVVFLTSVADRKAIYSVLKSVPAGYILKPPDKDRLLETIQEIFSEK